jgi:hypothetical protein
MWCDNVVQSHLVLFAFVNDYTIWKFHGEADASAGVARGNLSTSMVVVIVEHDGG